MGIGLLKAHGVQGHQDVRTIHPLYNLTGIGVKRFKPILVGEGRGVEGGEEAFCQRPGIGKGT